MDIQSPYTLKIGQSKSSSGVHRLLAVNEQQKSGLILCKPYHAEFAGPGALITTSAQEECVTIIAIGSPEIVEVTTHESRQRAFRQRIQWTRWLQKITECRDPIQRVEKLFESFEAFYGTQVLRNLPDEALALLIGVFPETVGSVRARHPNLRHSEESEPLSMGRSLETAVVSFAPHLLQIFRAVPTPFVVSIGLLGTGHKLPCSA